MAKTGASLRISMRSRIGFNFYDVFVYALVIGFGLLCFYPMWYVLIGSLSENKSFVGHALNLLPAWPPTFKYYQGILMSTMFQRALGISLGKTFGAAVVSVMLTATMAYAVSKEKVKGMKFLNFLVVFAMFFNGGLIPTYLLIRNLGMYDSIWALTIPWMLGATNFVIMRNYFVYSVPQELEESAAIDGANSVVVFLRIILPLSVPTLAAIFLFDAVAQWNDWYSYLIYAESPKLQPVVWVLRRMLIDPSVAGNGGNAGQILDRLGFLPPMALRMTTIILSMLPIMVVYPFLQRYFVKGIMIGAIKG